MAEVKLECTVHSNLTSAIVPNKNINQHLIIIVMKAAIRANADRVYCGFSISQINEKPNYLPNNLVVFKEKRY